MRSRRALSAAAFFAATLSVVSACSGNRDALARGQRYYEANQYERALAVWRELGRREAALEAQERVRYTYLRGMTDYRLGLREEARHWLGLARARSRQLPNALSPEWSLRLDAALHDLNRESFGLPAQSADPVQSIEAGGPPSAPR